MPEINGGSKNNLLKFKIVTGIRNFGSGRGLDVRKEEGYQKKASQSVSWWLTMQEGRVYKVIIKINPIILNKETWL